MSDATTAVVDPTAGRDPVTRAIADALAEPFEPREVKFKPQMVKNNRCLAMAYIDARLIQDRLDEAVGVENWEDGYKILADGSVMCRLRVKIGDRWVVKSDVGSPSEQPDGGDRLKAAFSDALKRAAVKFGIGRYLYRLQAQWVDYDTVKKQVAQVPQLPAFAIPKKKPAPKVEVKQVPAKTDGRTEGPKQLPAKTDAKEVCKDGCKGLPKDGNELVTRLKEYDRKLANEKLCPLGALVTHVTQTGVTAGYPSALNIWGGEAAMKFAVEAVKEFEAKVRKTAPAAA